MINNLTHLKTGRTAIAVLLAATLGTVSAQGSGNNQPSGQSAVTSTSNVVVTNTSAQPVPVTVMNQQAVSTVTVNNTSAQPLPTKDQNNGAYQPFHFTSAITTNGAFAQVNVPVPAGKRLVIEQVSAEVSLWNTTGSLPSISVMGYEAGVDATAWVPMTFIGEGSLGLAYFAVQPVHLYADGGTNAVLSLFKSHDTSHVYSGTVSGYISLAGHLVNIP